MDIEKDELPQGWAWATIADVVDTIRPKVSPSPHSTLPFLGLEHLEAHGMIPSGKGSFSEMKSSAASFKPGDVLYGRLRPYLNKVWCADYAGACSAEFIVMTPPKGVSGKFIRYLLHAQSFVSFASHTTSGDRPRADFDDLKVFEFALPPSREQDRIADKIDELFSDIEAGERSLRKVQALLKKHRQAVLKAAVTGELTRDWRDRHGPPAETGAALLTRILAARRAAWEADQHAKAKAAGKVLKGEAWKAKYEEPIAPTPWEIGLPSGWAWTAIQQLTPHDRACAYGVLQPGEDVEGGTPLVRVGDINGGKLDTSGLKRIAPAIADQFRRTFLQGDEVLITLVGAIGRTAVAPKSAAGFNTARAVGVIPLCPNVAPEWVEVSLRSPAFNRALIEASHEVARKTLNLEDVRAFTIPLPPLAEQVAVIDRVEEEMSKIDAMEAVVAAELKRSARLRQFILKAAFTGKLVPQNPTDEPATALLAHLRENRATLARPKRRGRLRESATERVTLPVQARRRGRPRKIAVTA